MIDPPAITLDDLAAQQRAKLAAIAAVTGGEVPELDLPKPEDEEMKGKPTPVECVESGERWRSMASLREVIGVKFETLAKAIQTGEQINGKTYRYAEIPPEAIDAKPTTKRPRKPAWGGNVEPAGNVPASIVGGFQRVTVDAPAETDRLEPVERQSRAKIVVIEVDGDEHSVRAAVDAFNRIMQERAS